FGILRGIVRHDGMPPRFHVRVVDSQTGRSDWNSAGQSLDHLRFDSEAEVIGSNENVGFTVESACVRYNAANIDMSVRSGAQFFCDFRHPACNDKPAAGMGRLDAWPHSSPEPEK